MALTDKLTAIADAIRGKTGKSDSMTLDQMPTEIAGIQAGGGGGTGGIGAVKFIDVDITVEASTTTAKTYAVDNLEFITDAENPKQWATFAGTEAYLAMVTPKEYTGEATGNATGVFKNNLTVLHPHSTNYTLAITVANNGVGRDVKAYGIYSVQWSCKKIVNNVPVGTLSVSVRHESSGNLEVIAGTYNVQIWYLTDFAWEKWT